MLEPPGGFDAIETRHGDVEHDHIGIELHRCAEQVHAVGNRPNNLGLAGQHMARLSQDLRMIIC